MATPRLFYGWIIATLGFLGLGLTGGIWYSFSVFFVALMQEFGAGRGETALTFSVYLITQGVINPFLGALLERFGIRRLMSAGGVVIAGALAACSFVSAPWQLYVVYGVLLPAGSCSIGSVVNYTVINRWFVKKRGLALGYASAGVGAIGIFGMVPLAQYLVVTVGWRQAYLVFAVIIALLVPIASLLFHRDRPQDMGLLPDGVLANPASPLVAPSTPPPSAGIGDPGPAPAPMSARQAVRTGHFWMIGLANLFMAIACQTVFVHQIAYFLDLGYSQFLAAAVVAVIGLFSILIKIGSGWLSDRLGRRVVYMLGGISLILSLVLLLVLPVVLGEWWLYAYALLFSVGYSTQTVLYPAVAGDLFSGRELGTIFGLLNVGLNFGSAIGAWLAGYLFDIGGSYAPAFVLDMAAVGIACALIWHATHRTARLSPRVASSG